jgi:hypothetical protein
MVGFFSFWQAIKMKIPVREKDADEQLLESF